MQLRRNGLWVQLESREPWACRIDDQGLVDCVSRSVIDELGTSVFGGDCRRILT